MVVIYQFSTAAYERKAKARKESPEVGPIVLQWRSAPPNVGRVLLSPTACSPAGRAWPRSRCLACSWVSNFKLDT